MIKFFCTIILLTFIQINSASFVFADTLYLRDGSSIEGLIVEQDEELIIFDIGDGFTVTYFIDELDRIASASSEIKEVLEEEIVLQEIVAETNAVLTNDVEDDIAALERKVVERKLLDEMESIINATPIKSKDIAEVVQSDMGLKEVAEEVTEEVIGEEIALEEFLEPQQEIDLLTDVGDVPLTQVYKLILSANVDQAKSLLEAKLLKHFRDSDARVALRVVNDYQAGKVSGDFLDAFFEGSIYLEENNDLQAFEQFAKCHTLDNEDSDVLTAMSLAVWRQGHAQEAIDYSTEAIESNPHNLDALFALGVIYLRQGNRGLAKEYFAQLVTLKDKGFISYRALGQAYFYTEDYRDAIFNFKKYIEHTDEDKHIFLTQIGRSYLRLNDLDQAISYLEQSVTAQSDNFLAYIELGRVYRLKEQYTFAINAFEQALALNKEKFDDHELLGHCYFKVKRLAEARVAVQNFLDEHSDDDNHHYVKQVKTFLDEILAQEETLAVQVAGFDNQPYEQILNNVISEQ
ncbi:MAG: tetratricopeptide (TPR) repeat protein [Candidatus Omnitrophota bacterium]|jgi:tetratricopeptide (TPR) repeat protein